MEYLKEKKEIILNRELNELDKFVLDFCNLLEDYVIVSGYVSILFGRSRSTEDVDLLVPKMNFEKFDKLWKNFEKNGFECINTTDPREGFKMLNEYAIRFFKKKSIPNMEFKMIKTDFDEYSFKNKIKVIINKEVLFVSPLEMQIAFKLFLAADGTKEELGADKDIEDARYIYKLFEDKIDKDELLKIANKLDIIKKLEWLK